MSDEKQKGDSYDVAAVMDGKKCSNCEQYLAPVSEHFYRRTGFSTYRSHCKKCSYIRARSRNYAYKRTDEYRKKSRAKGWSGSRQMLDQDTLEKRRSDDKARYQRNKFRHNIKRRVNECLREGKRGAPLEKVLGYTINDLRHHLERQFTGRMSWDNYGTYWHIDHIIPVSSFTFDGPDDDDFKLCWSLSNLRPLQAKENISKNATRTHLI